MLTLNNSILFEQGLNHSIILRKNIKVKSTRLPLDFFNSNELDKQTTLKRQNLVTEIPSGLTSIVPSGLHTN